MGNDLVTTDSKALSNSRRWQEPSLSERLLAKVEASSNLPDHRLPALPGDELEEARTALAIHRAAPRGSTPGAVDRVMARLVVAYPAAKLSDAEAVERAELYAELLSDIPADLLMAAAMDAIRSLKFFPSVAELHAHADRCRRQLPRFRQRNALARLIEAEEARRAAQDAAEYASPEEVAEIIRQFGLDRAAFGIPAEPERAARPARAPLTTADLDRLGIRRPATPMTAEEEAWCSEPIGQIDEPQVLSDAA